MSIGLDGMRHCCFVIGTDGFHSSKKGLMPFLSPHSHRRCCRHYASLLKALMLRQQQRPRWPAKKKIWSDVSRQPGECNCYPPNARGEERGSQAGLFFTWIIGITCMGVKLIRDSGAKTLFPLGRPLIELPADVRPAGGYLLPQRLRTLSHTRRLCHARRKEDNRAPPGEPTEL